MRRALRVLGVLVIAASLALSARIALVAYGPGPGPADLVAQTTFLADSLARGDDARMQRLFPEGAFFLTALTAAATSTASQARIADLRRLRDRLESPELTSTFGSGMSPEHGIFQAGWSLAVAVEVSAHAGDTVDRDVVRRRGEPVAAALSASQDPFLASYPGQVWPCDTVVAVASLARAAVLLGRADWLALAQRWRDRAGRYADPATGLLPHRTTAAGAALEGPRGSSQSIVQTFWPEIATALREPVDAGLWRRFVDAFVVREAGLVGVREFPRGRPGGGDVDSGPLVFGVSASASAVTLAAARTVGDDALATVLDREAELLGLPVSWDGRRRYAFGVLPVGDAFLAWARSRPLNAAALAGGSPRPWWPAFLVAALLPGLVAAGLLLRSARRQSQVASVSNGVAGR